MSSTAIQNEIIISNELEAVNLLEKILNNQIDTAHINLKVEKFTLFNMHVSGEQFHQTITTSVMKGFLEMQSAIYKSYSLIRYNDEVPNKLTQFDREDLELEVKVIDGTSGFEVDWDKLLNNLIDKTFGRMEGKHILVAVLSAIILYAGHSFYQTYISSQTEIRKLELEQKAKEQESKERLETIKTLQEPSNKALEILEKAVLEEPKVKTMQNDARKVTESMVKSVRNADNIEFQHAVSFSGAAAKEITSSNRSKWEAIRIDGFYQIIHVDSSNAANRKIKIKNIETGQELTAVLENDSLDQKNLNLIKNAEWGYSNIYLKIRALTLNGNFKNAEIVGAAKLEA
ncbi:hypothetical protein [Acinetobacter sp. Ac_5812]|uniref:hypothetical protein n=1 Tax=Acinetobacter sp. Ac_5812 TaxID=1848937 RepID=UPI00148FCE4C|nr:hypothetical protein [Acinetobacter sp. Ac_5812]NNP68932.1 hypothetical protein [Acinetobacter sp. Ac_5812]